MFALVFGVGFVVIVHGILCKSGNYHAPTGTLFQCVLFMRHHKHNLMTGLDPSIFFIRTRTAAPLGPSFLALFQEWGVGTRLAYRCRYGLRW
jgi:hypothetical protein